MSKPTKIKLAILTNILSPYRIPVFQQLSEYFTTLVLLSGEEDNRKWATNHRGYGFQVDTVRGYTSKRRVQSATGITNDIKYTHINPSYLIHLLLFCPNAIITTEMGFRSLIALIYGRIFNVPVGVWWGGTLHTESRISTAKHLLRRYFFARVVQRWLSYGETSTEYLMSLGIPRKRILQTQNCVDDHLYSLQSTPYPLDLPHPRALFVGQLIGRKGIYQLLEVTALIQQTGLEFSLVVIGDGPEAAHFKAEAKRLAIRNLHIIPYISPQQMPSIYKACDFLVFPTLEDVWGLVVNEALLADLPVIASAYAGCATELLPRQNIFDPLDSTSFVDKYRKAILGQLAPVDPSRLKSIREVSKMIALDIAQRLGRHSRESVNL